MVRRTAWPLVNLETECESTTRPLVNSLVDQELENYFC